MKEAPALPPMGLERKRPLGAWEIVFDAGYVMKDADRRRNRKFITHAIPSMQKDAAAKMASLLR